MVTAASLALADAGIEMLDLVAATSLVGGLCRRSQSPIMSGTPDFVPLQIQKWPGCVKLAVLRFLSNYTLQTHGNRKRPRPLGRSLAAE